MARILLADSDSRHRDLLRAAVARADLGEVRTAEDGGRALALLGTGGFDLAAIDLGLPRLGGLEVLLTIRRKRIPTDVVILAEQASMENVVEALRGGAQDFLRKTVHSADFVASAQRLLQKRLLPPHALADRLDRFLNAHATRGPMRLRDLCRHFNISSGYAARLFRKHLGTTFTERLIEYRLGKARELLDSTDTPVYLIADECGFRNARRFAETFRRWQGMSPTKFRQRRTDRQAG